MKLLTTCTSRPEAEMIKAKLEAYGIDVLIMADDEGGFHPGMAFVTGVRLFVPEEELARARDLIAPV